MSNKKRNQILAALLCATTMATFYGSPKAEAQEGDSTYNSVSGELTVANADNTAVRVTNLDLDGGTLKLGETGTLSLGNDVSLTKDQLTNINNVIKKDNDGTSITADKATIGGTTTIDSKGIATDSVTVGGMTIADGVITGTGKNGVVINGVELKENKVTATGGFTVNDANFLNSTTGLTASAATIGGNTKIDNSGITTNSVTANSVTATGVLKGASLALGDNATLDADQLKNINSIVKENGDITTKGNITTEGTLKGDKITDGTALLSGGDLTGLNNIEAGQYKINESNFWNSTELKAGKLDAAEAVIGTTTINSTGITTINGKVTVGDMNITDGAITDENGVAINRVSLAGGKVTAEEGFTVNPGNFLDSTGLTASAATISGDATVDGTFSAAKGNFIADTNGTTTKGEATFTNGGSTTTISGGTITADTLKVDKIILGKGSNDGTGTKDIVIGADGAFSAAGGNFKITGGEGDDRGAITNKVGNTSFETTADGITSTATDGNSNSSTSTITGTEITNKSGVASSTITGGNNANITNTVGEGETTKSVMTENSITDTVGDTTVTTTTGGMEIAGTGINEGNGMKVDTATGEVTFTNKDSIPVVTDGVTKTTINGNTITTGQITTDKLVITGNGKADDKGAGGSIAMGGDGSIVSNIKDGNNETKFQTTVEGITGTVTDDTNTTNTSTKATGTTIKVVDGTNEANSNVSADKIENSVNSNAVTIGTDGITSKVGDNVKTEMTTGGITSTVDSTSQTIGTSSVTTKVGDYQSELNADGMTITDGNIDNSTNITSGDVSIKTKDYDISLSQMGQVADIDGELQGRGEYKGTVVSGLNAEAAIRREEVARLDNRIDQTNERLDRVGAMAAAAASLKSMGYDPAAPTEFAMGVGTYKGSQAIAVGLFHYPNRDFMLNINYTQSAGEKMGGVGATWKFGRKNPDKVLDDQLKERQKKVKIAQEKAAAAAQLAKEADERAAYAARQAQHAKTQAATAYRDAEKAYLERESK